MSVMKSKSESLGKENKKYSLCLSAELNSSVLCEFSQNKLLLSSTNFALCDQHIPKEKGTFSSLQKITKKKLIDNLNSQSLEKKGSHQI